MLAKWKPGNLSSQDSGTEMLCSLLPSSVSGLPFPALLIVSTNMYHVPKWEPQGAVHTGLALRGPLLLGSKQTHSSSGLVTKGCLGQAELVTLELHLRDQEELGPQKGGGRVSLQGGKGPGWDKSGSRMDWKPPGLATSMAGLPQSGWGSGRGGQALAGQVWGSGRG